MFNILLEDSTEFEKIKETLGSVEQMLKQYSLRHDVIWKMLE